MDCHPIAPGTDEPLLTAPEEVLSLLRGGDALSRASGSWRLQRARHFVADDAVRLLAAGGCGCGFPDCEYPSLGGCLAPSAGPAAADTVWRWAELRSLARH